MAKRPSVEDAAGAAFESNEADNVLVSLRDVEEMSFECVPKGTYPIILEKLVYKLSESSGKPMWQMTLAIVDGTYKGKKIFPFISFSEGALPGTKAALRQLKPELLEADSFSPKQIAEEGSLIGWTGRVQVSVREYQGTDRNQVQAWMQSSGSSSGFAAG